MSPITEASGPAGFARRATSNATVRRAARAGYFISATLHLLIACIIVEIAAGSGGNADQSGALAALANTGVGFIALWGVALALVPLTLWRLAEAILGLHPAEHNNSDPADFRPLNRLKALGLAVVYSAVAFTAVQFALGRRKSSAAENAGLSARLMQSTPGKTVLVLVGLAIAAVGCYYAFKGASRKFVHDLNISPGPALTALGVCGYVAEGLVLAGAGLLVVVASVRSDPSKATGIDGAVKTLQQAPFGGVLILIAAAGFGAYSFYSFALIRHSRM